MLSRMRCRKPKIGDLAISVSAAFVFLLPGAWQTMALGQELPGQPDATARYVFYLHGRIIEDGELRPVHEDWGLYDYPAVVDALESRGAVVLSEKRPKDTDIHAYATKVLDQVENLIEAGVPQSRISVIGFSKGGAIAIEVSGRMDKRYSDIRYVFLAACVDWAAERPDLSISGRVLAVYEASDESTSSCKGLSGHSGSLTMASELTIDTGASHGAFYLPRNEWLEPVLQWIHSF